MEERDLISQISDSAAQVHHEMGPGLLEPVYRSCMMVELENRRLEYHAGVPVPIFYQGQRIQGQDLLIDLLVEDTIILELAADERLKEFHRKKIFTALRLSNKPVGVLINFGERLNTTVFPGFTQQLQPCQAHQPSNGGAERQRIAKQRDLVLGGEVLPLLGGRQALTV